MGHYDECREENCGICGQLVGFCEHTNNKGNDCTNCQKNEVCKWSKAYQDYVSLAKYQIPEEIRDFVKNEITCNYYLSKPKEGIR